ncbi:MAG TPA: pur operon repressor [Bacillota bacterium]|nr:pur operon repressor [Bacillota bacterium]
MRRSQRIAALIQRLVEQPGRVFTLTEFAKEFGAAKSSISEDLALARETFADADLGRIETYPGAAGGVTYLPVRSPARIAKSTAALAAVLAAPDRILAGGFVYMTDILFSPSWAQSIGDAFATTFAGAGAEYVVTVETKGIPIGLMTARALGRPLVLLRRDSRVTEGSSVSINYVSGSGQRIETMSLPRRALPQGARVLLVDDFMRGGGTARGMVDLVGEFGARVAGIGVVVATAEPARKRVDGYTALLRLEAVDEIAKRTTLRPLVPEGRS